MLIAGGACRIAIHAFQPWFKSLRNAIVSARGTSELSDRFDPISPFGDGYFNDDVLAVQRLLHAAPLDIPFIDSEWPTLCDSLKARAADEEPELCLKLSELAGANNYAEMLRRILGLIMRGSGTDTAFVGLIDTWIIDLLPALARSYPEAKFVIVLRDPRGVVASMLKFLDTAPETVGNILSILRQWRKYVAMAHIFGQQPLFADRLKVVRYEDQVGDPEQFACDLCDFLGTPYRAAMTNPATYEHHAGRGTWRGNSAFAPQLDGIDSAIAKRWHRTLHPSGLAAIEYCCGPDMEICGYIPINQPQQLASSPLPLAFLVEDGKRQAAWRTDCGDPAIEFRRETDRRWILESPVEPAPRDIERAYLDVAYYRRVRSGPRIFAPI